MSTMLKKKSKTFQKDRVRGQLMSDLASDNVVNRAISSLLTSLTTKGLDVDSVISPTSPFDFKSITSLGNSLINSPRSPKSWDSNRVGLGLVESLNNEIENVLLGSKMRISKSHLNAFKDDHVLATSPKSLPSNYPISSKTNLDSPKFAIGSIDNESKPNFEVFSIDLKNTKLDSSPLAPNLSNSLPIPTSGIELLEEYTCIISHGPNPKTIHIFGDCVLDSDTIGSLEYKNGVTEDTRIPFGDHLSYCFACKKKLEQRNDMFMYRGEKAFCSLNCRNQEILSDEESEKDIDEDFDDCLGSLFDEEIFA